MGELVPHDAPGLPADWLNGWLAAIGVTALVPEVKLSWTDDVVPHAVLWAPIHCDVAAEIWRRVPRDAALDRMAIAYDGPGGMLQQKVGDAAVYRARAESARRSHDRSLEASLTDLASEQDSGSRTEVARGQFCVGVEGDETLWRRLKKCVNAAEGFPDPVASLRATLFNGSHGVPVRVHTNGLGFDARRLPTGAGSDPKRWPVVDPLIEVLAFCAIQLLPVRGSGPAGSAVQKPWVLERQRPTLRYPCWIQPLDQWGIDALLDAASTQLGVTQWFRVRRLRPLSGMKKAAYFSEPLP